VKIKLDFCCIPELFGIGKGTARGFGTVKIEE
jgi:CRISPR/Cas system endoribonuclease Cas6 (RAMP superfamily)